MTTSHSHHFKARLLIKTLKNYVLLNFEVEKNIPPVPSLVYNSKKKQEKPKMPTQFLSHII